MLSSAVILMTALLGAATEREKLVVMEVTSGDDSTRRTAHLVEEQLLTELTRVQGVEVIGQNEIVAALGLERQRQLLGCTEGQSCLAEIGGALGSRWLVMSSLGRFGSRLRFDLKLVDTRNGKAVAREGRVLEHDDDLFPAVTELVAVLVRALGLPAAQVQRAGLPGLVWLVSGGAAALLGGLSMGLGSMWGAELNTTDRSMLAFPEARSRMGLFQVMYWGGLGLAVIGAALVGVGVWAAIKPSEPAKSVSPVAFALTPTGFGVRW